MEQKDLISIIVPCYNAGKTLHRCIDSILAQTHKQFELIVVDDCSADDSREIVSEYAARDPRVRLLAKEHGGVAAARNAGLKLAEGNYVQFVDSDDHIESDMLASMLRLLKKERADVCVCNYFHPCIKNYLGNRVLNLTRREDVLRYVQTTFALVVPWNKLYRREVLTEPFDEEVSFCEDDLFGLANLKNVKKVVSTDRALYHYFVAPPETKEEELSCINKMARDKDFWRNRNTYWYKRHDLLEKSLAYLVPAFGEERGKELAYARMFDFVLWELIILTSTGVDRDGLTREMQNLFREKAFEEALKEREKYGVRLREMTDAEFSEAVLLFTHNCINACREITEDRLPVRPYFVCLQLFVHYFIEEFGPLDPTDQLAEAYRDRTLGILPECRYVSNRYGITAAKKYTPAFAR